MDREAVRSLTLVIAMIALASPARASLFEKGGLLGVGAREMAQGGAVVARQRDSGAMWWNPAGLEPSADYGGRLDYGQVLGGRYYDTAISQKGAIIPKELAYGLGYRYKGTSALVDEEELSLGLSLPFDPGGDLRAGFALRFLQARVVEVRTVGFGLDLGLRYHLPTPWGLNLALAARDIQSGMDGKGPRDDPDQAVQGGLSWDLDSQTSFEMDMELNVQPQRAPAGSQGFRLGGEHWFGLKPLKLQRFWALRLGYLQSSAVEPSLLGGQFSLGLGLAYGTWSLDYAFFQGPESLGSSHRLGLGFAFVPPKATASATPTASPTPLSQPTETMAVISLATLTATATTTPSPTLTFTPSPTPPSGGFRLIAEAESFAPVAQSLRPLAVFRAQGAPSKAGWSLSLRKPGSPTILREYKGTALPDRIAWNGKDQRGRLVADGLYLARLSLPGRRGQTQTAESTVTLSTQRPALTLAPESRIFGASEAASQGLTFAFQTSFPREMQVRWTLRVFTAQGRAIARAAQEGPLPSRWSLAGTDREGAALVPGLYYAEAGLESKSGSLARPARVTLVCRPVEPSQPFRVPLAVLNFKEPDAVIALEDYKAIKDAAAAIRKYGQDYQVVVLGRSAGGERSPGGLDELELSFLRANAVKDYLLESEGLPTDRVSAYGAGAESGDVSVGAPTARAEIILYAR